MVPLRPLPAVCRDPRQPLYTRICTGGATFAVDDGNSVLATEQVVAHGPDHARDQCERRRMVIRKGRVEDAAEELLVRVARPLGAQLKHLPATAVGLAAVRALQEGKHLVERIAVGTLGV